MSEEKTAIEVLKKVVLDRNRVLGERQRAIDALMLFRKEALSALKDIARKTDAGVLKERAELYIQRINSGAITSMTI